MTWRVLVPVVADGDTRENIDDECDNTEDRGKGHQCVHRLAEVDTKSRDVRRVTKDTEVKKEDGQLGRPDGEFVQYLRPPEPLLRLAMPEGKSDGVGTMRALASCSSVRVDMTAP